MTKGKYAARADTRLRVLESAALKEAHATIRDLQRQLAETNHKLNTAQAHMQSQAMQAAAGLSAREKQNLRNQIASLEHQNSEDRIRYAVLTWEAMHRLKFNRPSPAKLFRESSSLPKELPKLIGPETDHEIITQELNESYEYWHQVHMEIAPIFLTKYAEVLRFDEIVLGWGWRLAGDEFTTTRRATRIMKKGAIADYLTKQIRTMREYYDRIWKARLAGDVEPVAYWADMINWDSQADEDRYDNLLERMRKREQKTQA